jgi:fucose permease
MSPNRRGPALNFLNLFFGLGGIVTTYAASYLFTPVAICYSIAILAVLAMFTCYFAPMVKAAGAVGFRLSEVPRLLGNPLLILFSLLLFFYVACEVGVWNWLKAYLISAHLDARTAGGTVSYGFASGMLLGRLLVSRILTKVSAMHVLSMAAPLIALTTFGVLRAGSSISGSRISVTALVFGAGLAMAPVFPTTLALVGDHFPQRTATAMGIAITSGWIGLAFSSPIIGWLAGGSTLGHALLVLPWLACAMVLVNMVLTITLRKLPAR